MSTVKLPEKWLHTLNLMAEVFRITLETFRVKGCFVQKDSETCPEKYRTLDVFPAAGWGAGMRKNIHEKIFNISSKISCLRLV